MSISQPTAPLHSPLRREWQRACLFLGGPEHGRLRDLSPHNLTPTYEVLEYLGHTAEPYYRTHTYRLHECQSDPVVYVHESLELSEVAHETPTTVGRPA